MSIADSQLSKNPPFVNWFQTPNVKHRFMISRNTNHQHITAYWIAFGPHGPRALPPPGEGKKVFFYTAIGVGVSFALFAFIRMFAGPEPHTMTKEWQEASNEYLKVRTCPLPPALSLLWLPLFPYLLARLLTAQFLHCRLKRRIPSRVWPPQATPARVWYSPRPSRHNNLSLPPSRSLCR